MKAIICTKYGSPDVLQLQDVEKPTPTPALVRLTCPGGRCQGKPHGAREGDEVLIKVCAACINAYDCALDQHWCMSKILPSIYSLRFSQGVFVAGEPACIRWAQFSDQDQRFNFSEFIYHFRLPSRSARAARSRSVPFARMAIPNPSSG